MARSTKDPKHPAHGAGDIKGYRCPFCHCLIPVPWGERVLPQECSECGQSLSNPKPVKHEPPPRRRRLAPIATGLASLIVFAALLVSSLTPVQFRAEGEAPPTAPREADAQQPAPTPAAREDERFPADSQPEVRAGDAPNPTAPESTDTPLHESPTPSRASSSPRPDPSPADTIIESPVENPGDADPPVEPTGAAEPSRSPIPEANPPSPSDPATESWTAEHAYSQPARVAKAIRDGCNWLIKWQDEDGSWSLGLRDEDEDEFDKRNLVAATSLALLALQGDGHNGHGATKFDSAVAKGHVALQQMREQSKFRPDLHSLAYGTNLAYSKSLAALAVCDLATRVDALPPRSVRRLQGDDQETNLKVLVQTHADEVLERQNLKGDDRGGWGYARAGVDPRSDISVSGWSVRALLAAKRAGAGVPRDRTEAAREYLEGLWRAKGQVRRYIYALGTIKDYADAEHALKTLGGHASATGCVRLLGGEPHADAYRLVTANARRIRNDAYFGLWAASALAGRPEWDDWWPEVERALLRDQLRGAAISSGAWSPDGDVWLSKYNAVAVTCFRLITLETPIRYEQRLEPGQ